MRKLVKIYLIIKKYMDGIYITFLLFRKNISLFYYWMNKKSLNIIYNPLSQAIRCLLIKHKYLRDELD